jgi:GNAT superfamily N-acetyltransferase
VNDAMTAEPIRLEPATQKDVPVILRFIKELAEYEKLSQEVVATEDSLRTSLFGARPAAEVVIAYASDEPVGFALYFQTFSTFLGRPGIYLEDLYVTPTHRGQSIGRRLLAYVARVAVDRGYGRMEWSVLNWNEPALIVYRKIGARPMDEWTVQRLTGDALISLAQSA